MTAGFIAGAVLFAACGGPDEAASGGEDPAAETPVASTITAPTTPPQKSATTAHREPGVLRDGIPDVDTSVRIVELGDVHFDTFDGRSIPLDQTSIEVRRALLDAIRPLDSPSYDDVTGGDWLDPTDLVIGYVAGDQAYAFPHKVLNFHEIVNDTFDGVPVLVSYCPLCRSGVVFDRRLGDRTLTFSNTSALYESDLVMVDRQTGSYWWQVPGRAIVGPLSGQELTTLPSVTTTWADWKALHQDTLVLGTATGLGIDYGRDPFVGYGERIEKGSFVFPVSDESLDARLTPGTIVVGIEAGSVRRVYPVEGERVINDRIGGDEVVVLTWDGGGAAFSRNLAGDVLTFESAGGAIVDAETGSMWSADGVATSGPLEGSALDGMPIRVTFWFAYVGAFPDAEVFRG